MASVVGQLRKEEYELGFKVDNGGLLCTMDGKQQFGPEEVQVVNFYSLEG
ncbi:hypothetical protein [Pontibacter litorisediminis]|nr:hypothetical protein [Pontibacter litorisediminis]